MDYSTKAVIVTNVDPSQDEDTIKVHFSSTGLVIDHIFHSPADGIAYVVFAEEGQVDQALADFHESILVKKLDVRRIPSSRIDELNTMMASRTAGTTAGATTGAGAAAAVSATIDVSAIILALSSLSKADKDRIAAGLGYPIMSTPSPVTPTTPTTIGGTTTVVTSVPGLITSSTTSTGTLPTTAFTASSSASMVSTAPSCGATTAPTATPSTAATAATPWDHSLTHFQYPRLSKFSGDSKSATDTSYQQWRFEVVSAQSRFNPQALMQGIVLSLGGMAKESLRFLGPSPSIPEVLSRFDNIFGNALAPDQLMEQFYRATQKTDESIPAWACRLEGLGHQVCQADPSSVTSIQATMRNKFWSGLSKQRVKDALRYRYDQGDSFDDLLKAARQIEAEENPTSSKSAKVQFQSAGKPESGIEAKLDALIRDFAAFKKKVESKENTTEETKPKFRKNWKKKKEWKQKKNHDGGETKPFQGMCYKCEQHGHRKADCPLNFSSLRSGDGS